MISIHPIASAILTQACATLVAGVAAVVDHRRGTIPNWLTLPVLCLGPAFWGLAHGGLGLAESVAGILICGLPPFVVYRAGGMPGGDLKLFAAVGGLVGPSVGIEIELYAMVAASLFGIALLARKGRLLETMRRAFFLVFNRFLPKAWRRQFEEGARDQIRMGPFVLVGTLAAIALHGQDWVGYFER